jgi:hypothetical protein
VLSQTTEAHGFDLADEARNTIKLGFAVRGDGTTVRVTIPAEEPVTLVLDTAGVEALMKGLAEIRADMTPAVPPEWATGQAAAGVRSPRFVCEEEALHGGSLLHLRHPGYGWLHFAFPAEVARRLGAFLLRQAKHARVKPAPPGRN